MCLGENVGEKLLHFCASSGWQKMKLYKNNMVLAHFELYTCSSKEENLITICYLLYAENVSRTSKLLWINSFPQMLP